MQNRPPKATRYALITGAASGLGREIAVRLARDGWCIAIADIDQPGSVETLKLVEAAGGSGLVESLEVSQIDQWQALIGRLQSNWPRLDMLVNNAGVGCSGRVGATPIADWRWLIEINLFGVINGCHACLAWLKQSSSRASLVNISSLAAVLGAPAMGPYNVAKAGVLALSETLACELAATNVRVTVACPGFFRTKILENGRYQTPLEREFAERYTAAARMNAEQIADAIVRAADRGQLYAFMPARARWIWYLRRLAPRLVNKLVGAGYARELAKAAACDTSNRR